MEALQKRVDLGLDRMRHLVLAHQLHVLTLVFFGDSDVMSILDEVGSLLHPKLITLRRESQIQHIRDVVLQGPAQVAEILRVERLQIGREHLHSQHVLVETSREKGLQHVPVVDGLADDPPREIEILQVLPVHIRHWIGVVRACLATRLSEQSVVRVENLLGQRVKPLLHHAAGVDPLFALELNVNLRLQLLGRPPPQLVVRIHEDLGAPHLEADRVAAHVPPTVLCAEIGPLVVEVQHSWHLQQWCEGFGQKPRGLLDQRIQWLSVLFTQPPELRPLNGGNLLLLPEHRQHVVRLPRRRGCH
mmetsp:Transcript_95145/g.254291  ORF Transcript_95145/g.254291 Transcript_95145/m.254291 type:complete len:303 (-) Transcript_95145:181-1089(-)